jgi:hypothetical protein
MVFFSLPIHICKSTNQITIVLGTHDPFLSKQKKVILYFILQGSEASEDQLKTITKAMAKEGVEFVFM